MNTPKELFNDRPDSGYEAPSPPGRLRTLMHDRELQARIARADVVLSVHPTTGEVTGLFYGVAQLNRIARRGVPEEARVTHVSVDETTDDIDVLCALVEVFKGACCYPAE